MGELVHCSIDGGIATITLDSQANRNALSRQLLAELNEALDRAAQTDVRAVVLVTHFTAVKNLHGIPPLARHILT